MANRFATLSQWQSDRSPIAPGDYCWVLPDGFTGTEGVFRFKVGVSPPLPFGRIPFAPNAQFVQISAAPSDVQHVVVDAPLPLPEGAATADNQVNGDQRVRITNGILDADVIDLLGERALKVFVINPSAPSGPGTTTMVSMIAGEALGGHRLVMSVGGPAFYYDPSVAASAGYLIGMTIGAAAIGSIVQVATRGVVNNPGWGLTPGAIYFALPSGLITTTPPTTGVSHQIGVALDPNNLDVDPLEPITLS